MNRTRLLAALGIVLALGLLLFFVLGQSGDSKDASSGAKAKGQSTAASRVALHRETIDDLPKASISGAIVDESDKPVAGARVCAAPNSQRLATEDQLDPICVLAGPDGRYRLAELLPASYSLSASARGFVASTYEYELDGKTQYELALAAGEARESVDLVLEHGGVEVKGIVTDIGGGSVAGAWVSVSSGGQFRFGRMGGSDPAITVSLDDGSFSVWVAEGGIRASASASGYADGSSSGIAPGQYIEIVMTPESVLAGKVVEAGTGKPVADAMVSAGSINWMDGSSTARTDENGNFRITRLSPGRYKPSAEIKGGYGVASESVLAGLGQTREDIIIELHPALVVSGQVLVEGSNDVCPEASVSLEDSTGQSSKWGEYDKETKRLEIKAVLPGTYQVKARCEDYVSLDEYPPIVIADADVVDQKWFVRSGEKLIGRVVDSRGAAIADASIFVRSVGGDPRAQRSGGYDDSKEDGAFEITGLLPGEYSVRANSDEHLRPEEEPKVVVEEGKVAEIELVLEDGAGLRGVVVDENGQPVVGARVRARSLSNRRGGGSSQARDDGSFEIDALRPGKYRVSASKGFWGGDTLRSLGKGDDDVQGEEATVEMGKTVELRLVVESQDGTISGQVVDEAGQPVSDAFIDSERQSEAAGSAEGSARQGVRWGRWDSKLQLTDVDGRFTLTGLADGTYTLLAYRKGGGEAIAENVAVGSEATLTITSTGSMAGSVAISGGGFPTVFTISVSDKSTGYSRSEEFYRSEGRWALRELPAGNYSVDVQATEGTSVLKDIALAEGQDVSDLKLSLEARATVTGQLVTLETGDPVPGMSISVSLLSGGGGFSFMSSPSKERISDAEGRFTVEDAPAGRVSVMGFPINWSDSEFGWTRFVAQLEAGKTNDIGVLRVAKRRLNRGEAAGDLGFTLHEQAPTTEPEDAESKVALVRPDGPAAKSGLKAGDIIVEIDGHDITGLNSYLYWSLGQVKPGVTITLTLDSGESIKIKAAAPR